MTRQQKILVAKEPPYLTKNITNYINEIPSVENARLERRALYAIKDITQGPQGGTGPSGINTTITAASYGSSILTIPAQSVAIAYYSVTLPIAGDAINTINFTSFPSGYQAIVFVNGSVGTSGNPCIITSTITGVHTNLNTNIQLFGSPAGNLQYATINITYDGSLHYANIVAYY
jgi:hypothetical protein